MKKFKLLDPHIDKIKQLISDGSTITAIARKYNVAYAFMWRYIHTRKLKQKQKGPRSKLEKHKEKIRQLLSNGVTQRQAATIYEISDSGMRHFVRLNSLAPPINALDQHREKINELISAGTTVKEIASTYGVNKGSVYWFIKTRGLSFIRQKTRKPSLAPHHQKIKKAINDGVPLSWIARYHGVAYSTVNRYAHKHGMLKFKK